MIEKAELFKKKIKARFDRRAKEDTFMENDMVLRWDARRDEKGKHGKFDNMWFGPFKIAKILGNNTFILQNLEGEEISDPVIGWFLKQFYTN